MIEREENLPLPVHPGLAEGAGRYGQKDQKKFFRIATASLRECQAVLDIEDNQDASLRELADTLGAHLYKLLQY